MGRVRWAEGMVKAGSEAKMVRESRNERSPHVWAACTDGLARGALSVPRLAGATFDDIDVRCRCMPCKSKTNHS